MKPEKELPGEAPEKKLKVDKDDRRLPAVPNDSHETDATEASRRAEQGPDVPADERTLGIP